MNEKDQLNVIEARWHLDEELKNILALPDVLAVMAYRSDGELVSSYTQSNLSLPSLAEILLWIKKEVQVTAKDMFRSTLKKAIYEVFNVNILFYPLGSFGILSVIANTHANLGLLMIELRRKSEIISSEVFQ